MTRICDSLHPAHEGARLMGDAYMRYLANSVRETRWQRWTRKAKAIWRILKDQSS